MNIKTSNKIFQLFSQHIDSPTTELVFENGFQLLVAVILSAQTTDKEVNKATAKIFPEVKSPEDLLLLGGEKLEKALMTLGLYRNKTKYLLSMSRDLIEKFGSEVPRSRKDLESLSGVGRKTANVILNTLYGEAVIAVDTHVFRVSRRLGLAHSSNVVGVEQELYQSIGSDDLQKAHHYLVLHGRYVCKAMKPLCDTCYLFGLCEYANKGRSSH